MPDGKLKLLDMYSKMTEMTTILAADTSENRFFDMEYFRLCQTITAMCAGANKLYADSANGQNSYDTMMGVEELKKNYLELHASLGAFRERYMSQTENPNSPFANKLRDLENDVREDREVLRTMDLQPGMSLMNAVYESQKKLELGQPEEEQELPGYDTVHKTDYPSFETLHGLPREDPPEQTLPPEDYPSETTLRMQAGYGMPAVQPYENPVYGTDTFYQNEMDLPSAEDVKRADNEKRKKTTKSLQIWTVAPLTNAIADETAKTDPAASSQMLKVNMSMQALFNTVMPFNPGRQYGEEPRVPNEQDIAELKAKTAQAHEQLRQWKEAYLQGTEKPSEQVLFMTDNVLKKLEDDFQVIGSVMPGETLPEAAFRCSRLPKHFGLENDRATPIPCPQKNAEAERQAQAQTQVHAPKEPPAAEERIPPPEELYRAFYELQGIQDAMVKADPKWMLTSSGAYGEMRRGIEGTIKFVLKNRDVFSTTPDPNSPAYQKAAKEFMQRLDASKGKVAAYLDKKAVDLGTDAGRVEDAGKQQWEQKRILAALTSYDKLSALTSGRATEKTAETDARVESFKRSLLSEQSKEKLEAESRSAGEGGRML